MITTVKRRRHLLLNIYIILLLIYTLQNHARCVASFRATLFPPAPLLELRLPRAHCRLHSPALRKYFVRRIVDFLAQLIANRFRRCLRRCSYDLWISLSRATHYILPRCHKGFHIALAALDMKFNKKGVKYLIESGRSPCLLISDTAGNDGQRSPVDCSAQRNRHHTCP